ncbi:hypothetical protein NPIL_133221, partial [Nephila pilipes]
MEGRGSITGGCLMCTTELEVGGFAMSV